MDETLLVTKENGILTIKFNNQKSKNSITNKMMIKWRELLVSAKTDDSINIIYLTGVGENFTSGNDFNNFQEGIDNEYTDAYTKIANIFTKLGKMDYVEKINETLKNINDCDK